MKRCLKCGDTKSRQDFDVQKACRDGLQAWCRKCHASYHATWRVSSVGKASRRNTKLKITYGLTPENHAALFAAQGGTCKFSRCSRGATDVDHNHAKVKGEPGFVRGLLCPSHNHALGAFDDDPTYLLEAVAYLRGELKK